MSVFRTMSYCAVVLALGLGACDDDDGGPDGLAPTSGGGGGGGSGGSAGSTAIGGMAGSGGSVGGSTSTAGSGGVPSGPGTITISASDIADQNGGRLIASVRDLADTETLAGICASISGNPGSASGVASEVDQDVCTLGAEVVFDPDTYLIKAGIYPQGEPAPILCASQQIAVAGDVEVVLDNFSDCI